MSGRAASLAGARTFALSAPRSIDARPPRHAGSGTWSVGVDLLDRLLPADGLHAAGVHEIKPERPGDVLASLGFALALGARREHSRRSGIVWVQPVRDAAEHGRAYGPGLLPFGVDPARLVIVEPANLTQSLWAIEESLKGGRGAIGFVLACCGAACGESASARARVFDITAQRRLSLAAAHGATPCLLVTSHAGPGLSAAHTRWRIARLPSRPLASSGAISSASLGSRFQATAIMPDRGRFRLRVQLERCRGAAVPLAGEGPSFDLEWCDEAYRFRLLAPVADRAACEPPLAGSVMRYA